MPGSYHISEYIFKVTTAAYMKHSKQWKHQVMFTSRSFGFIGERTTLQTVLDKFALDSNMCLLIYWVLSGSRLMLSM